VGGKRKGKGEEEEGIEIEVAGRGMGGLRRGQEKYIVCGEDDSKLHRGDGNETSRSARSNKRCV